MMAFNLQSTIDSYTAFNANKSLSVPGPHVRPNIIPRIGSNASLISQGSQYIQQKVVEKGKDFYSFNSSLWPSFHNLGSFCEYLARALQSLGTGKSLSPQIFPKSSSGRPKNVSTGHLPSSGLPSILPICSSATGPLQDRAQCSVFFAGAPRSA